MSRHRIFRATPCTPCLGKTLIGHPVLFETSFFVSAFVFTSLQPKEPLGICCCDTTQVMERYVQQFRRLLDDTNNIRRFTVPFPLLLLRLPCLGTVRQR